MAAAFRAAWRDDADPAAASVELLPVRLARACVAVLPTQGAGLSLHQAQFRVPIGASDEISTVAERMQFTQGEGPCLESATSRRSLRVGAEEMEERWPSFAAELFRRTPYRAIVSLPLAITPKAFGALDLFFVDSAAMAALRPSDAAAISAQIAEALAAAVEGSAEDGPPDGRADEGDDAVIPPWLRTEPARRRTNVWVAMGMVMTQFGISAPDALALLRSFSYGHDRLLDDVATALVSGALDLADLRP